MSFLGDSRSPDPMKQLMPMVAQGMARQAGGDSNVPTLASAAPVDIPKVPAVAPPTAPASPAQAPSYAARAAGRSGPRGGVASTILTSGAGLTTRAATGQKTLLGQ